MSEPTDELAQFRSIKRVKAGEITDVLRFGCYVRNADGSVLLRGYPPDMTARYTPVVGDYWVIYDDDGYQSISPKAAFEAGYVLISKGVDLSRAEHARSYAGMIQWSTADMDPHADPTVALLNMDGSIWGDWDRLRDMANHPTGTDPRGNVGVMYASLILGARGHFPEVSRERSEEIALEYGAKLLG